METEILEVFQLDELQGQISNLFQNQEINLISLVIDIASGELALNKELIIQLLFGNIINGFESIKSIIIMLLLIGITAAIFTNFASIFKNSQVSEIGHYLLYLLLIMILLRTFDVSLNIAKEAVGQIVIFVQMIIPTLYLAIGIGGGISSAFGFYQIIILIIFVVESVLLTVIIPSTYCYVFLTIINGLMDDNKLESFMNLIEKMIKGSLKILLTVVTGASVLQSMITPVIDGVKTTILQKSVSIIPGLGNIADSVSEVLLGSTILIKNSIGLVFLILLMGICLSPIIHLCIITISLKITSAILAILCDDRITKCIDKVGEGNGLLLKTVITSISLFLITIAIVTVSTSKGY